MGRLPDNILNHASNTKSAVPGGNVAKPLIIALLALLAPRDLGGGPKDQSAPAGSKPAPKSPEPMPASEPTPDSVLGGLGAFIEQFQQRVSAKPSIPGSTLDRTKMFVSGVGSGCSRWAFPTHRSFKISGAGEFGPDAAECL